MSSLQPRFHNVTLACEEGMYFLTYKVILVPGSAFSAVILRKNPHPYPLIYKKGEDQPEFLVRAKKKFGVNFGP